MDIDNEMSEYRQKREAERQTFMEKCLSTIKDGEFAYYLLILYVCKRYNIDTDYNIPYFAYNIVEYYINKGIEVPFSEWLNQDDAPLVRSVKELPKIFPEFKTLAKDEHDYVELANSIYGLELELDGDKHLHDCAEYVYAYKFDFNSFTPINIDELKELLRELQFCKKYNIDTTELENRINEYGFTEEQIKKMEEKL